MTMRNIHIYMIHTIAIIITHQPVALHCILTDFYKTTLSQICISFIFTSTYTLYFIFYLCISDFLILNQKAYILLYVHLN